MRFVAGDATFVCPRPNPGFGKTRFVRWATRFASRKTNFGWAQTHFGRARPKCVCRRTRFVPPKRTLRRYPTGGEAWCEWNAGS